MIMEWNLLRYFYRVNLNYCFSIELLNKKEYNKGTIIPSFFPWIAL